MTTNIEDLVKKDLELGKEAYEALTFKDLKVGDRYIAFPRPGDNEGHGGFLGENYVFEKLKKKVCTVQGITVRENARSRKNEIFGYFQDDALVIKVEW
jgi:hypothetical protein